MYIARLGSFKNIAFDRLHPVQLSGGYYNFSNIRYAAPPLGDLRFAAPQPPLDDTSKGIQDGSYGFMCPQSMAAWVYSKDADGNHVNQTGNVTYEVPSHSADESEDCLFLDFVVPKNVFIGNRQSEEAVKKSTAPVLVWIFGGAYVMGNKALWGDPMGLVAHNKNAGREDFIFVAMNYRVSFHQLAYRCTDCVSSERLDGLPARL